jgi:uncharacterized membrane protein
MLPETPVAEPEDTPESRTFVIRPQRSLTWPEARRWLWILSLIPATSGTLSLFYGAPLVLPFAGLEIALLWSAFYWVNITGREREVVRFEAAAVVVEKGRDSPREVHRFDRHWLRIELRPSPRRWHASQLCLCSHGREVAIGHFLTEGEREKLAAALINALRKTR